MPHAAGVSWRHSQIGTHPVWEDNAMHTMNRRAFLKTASASTLAAVYPHYARAAAGQRPPNIVFIMVDDMGYADLGCYGSQAVHTPRIDRMAAEGMRFTDAYSGCTVCAPARSTLMTGQHMGHTPVRGNTGGIALPDKAVTAAEILKQAGYATGGFGKWGLGDLDTEGVPEKQGFDLFYGYYHQIHAHYYYPDYLIRNGTKEALPGNADNKQTQYSHYLIFEEMLGFIRANKDRPFFCYAPWTPPHGRYEIPEDEPAWQRYKDQPWPHKAKVAAAMDTMVDRHVGQVLDLLDELGLADDTVVFFCSDNGAAERFEGALDSSGPLHGRKRDMYEGGLRVPFIVRWPGKIKRGTVSDLPCYFPDMLPTFAALAGAAAHVPENVDGVSIAPTLLGEDDQVRHECLYWEWPLYDWRTKRYPESGLMQGLRSGKWKLVRPSQDVPWELYDLSADPGETNDIAADHHDIAAKLTAWIAANRTAPGPQIEPEQAEGRKYR